MSARRASSACESPAMRRALTIFRASDARRISRRDNCGARRAWAAPGLPFAPRRPAPPVAVVALRHDCPPLPGQFQNLHGHAQPSLIEAAPMPDFLSPHRWAFHAELQPVIAGSQPIMSCQRPGQGLRAAHRRPGRQPFQQRHDARMNNQGQVFQPFGGFRRQRQPCHDLILSEDWRRSQEP